MSNIKEKVRQPRDNPEWVGSKEGYHIYIRPLLNAVYQSRKYSTWPRAWCHCMPSAKGFFTTIHHHLWVPATYRSSDALLKNGWPDVKKKNYSNISMGEKLTASDKFFLRTRYCSSKVSQSGHFVNQLCYFEVGYYTYRQHRNMETDFRCNVVQQMFRLTFYLFINFNGVL